MDADHFGAAGVFCPVCGGIAADLLQMFFRKGHAGGTNVRYALTEFIVCNGLQSVRGGVAEILADTAVEMDVDQSGDHIAVRRVKDDIVVRMLCDQSTGRIDVPCSKAMFQIKDRASGYTHRLTSFAVCQ